METFSKHKSKDLFVKQQLRISFTYINEGHK